MTDNIQFMIDSIEYEHNLRYEDSGLVSSTDWNLLQIIKQLIHRIEILESISHEPYSEENIEEHDYE